MSASRIPFLLAAFVFALMELPVPANAFGIPAPDAPQLFFRTDANCYAIGQKIAAQKGGDLMQASESSRGGKSVCHIVIRIPGNDGKRPRRAEFTVPAN